MLSDGEILEILTPQKSITYENANDILLGVEFGANSQFSRELSKNTKRGLKEKVLRGEWPTYAPPFYINEKLEDGSKNIVPNKDNYLFYEKMVDEIISRKIPSDRAFKLLEKWNVKSKRGTAFSRNTVNRLLRNKVYYGGLEYKDMPERKGEWEPIISKEKWLTLQEILDDKSKPIQSTHNLPFRRQITCEKCGYTVVPYKKTKKSGKSYTYYSCSKRGGNCGNTPIRQEDLEIQILEHLSEIKLDNKTLEYLKLEASKKLDEEMEYEFLKLDQIKKEYKEVQEQLNNLLKIRVNNEISAEEYREAKTPLTKRQNALEELRNDIKYDREGIKEELELFFEECFNIDILFKDGTPDEKSQLLSAITTNLTLDEGVLGWNFKKPWSYMISVDISDKNFKWGGEFQRF